MRMRIETRRDFRYLADLVCVMAIVIYVVNRWLLKPHGIGGAFAKNYLNDVLCLPLFVPVSLGLQRLLRVRQHDGRPRLWEVFQHWAVFSVMFELVIPRFPRQFHSTADPLDVLAYLGGGLAAWFVWSWASARNRGSDSSFLGLSDIKKV